jgi:energy-coupling factor transporter ATP-binding protein EcfA2
VLTAVSNSVYFPSSEKLKKTLKQTGITRLVTITATIALGKLVIEIIKRDPKLKEYSQILLKKAYIAFTSVIPVNRTTFKTAILLASYGFLRSQLSYQDTLKILGNEGVRLALNSVSDKNFNADNCLERLSKEEVEIVKKPIKGTRRGEDLERVLTMIENSRDNSFIVLKGPEGSGKSTLFKQIAQVKMEKDEGKYKFPIYKLKIGKLRNLKSYVEELEERLLILEMYFRDIYIKTGEKGILFLDEVASLDSPEEGGANFNNAFKLLQEKFPSLSFIIVGATTDKEFEDLEDKDPAMVRRFNIVQLESISEADAQKILESAGMTSEEFSLIKERFNYLGRKTGLLLPDAKKLLLEARGIRGRQEETVEDLLNLYYPKEGKKKKKSSSNRENLTRLCKQDSIEKSNFAHY